MNTLNTGLYAMAAIGAGAASMPEKLTCRHLRRRRRPKWMARFRYDYNVTGCNLNPIDANVNRERRWRRSQKNAQRRIEQGRGSVHDYYRVYNERLERLRAE